MTRVTIRQQVIDKMAASGYELAGETSGWLSFRKNSNLSGLLERLNLKPEEVEIRTGAKLQHATQGRQIFVFTPIKRTEYLISDNASEFLRRVPMSPQELAELELNQTAVKVARVDDFVYIDGRSGAYRETQEGFLAQC